MTDLGRISRMLNEPISTRGEVVAKVWSTCPICREPIEVDDLIRRHEGRWAHSTCSQGARRG